VWVSRRRKRQRRGCCRYRSFFKGKLEEESQQEFGRRSRQLLTIEVEVRAQTESVVVGVLALQPTIEELMQVVQVLLAPAAGRGGSLHRIPLGHMLKPSIVVSSSLQDVSTVLCEDISEELGASLDIEFLR